MSDPLVRHWDPKGEYEGAVLKVYEYWCLEVSWQQHTLGCYIIFCRREGVRLMSRLTIEEIDELRHVMAHMEIALRNHEQFRPDHFNYLQMGNVLPLLHFHGIPRYKESRPLSRTLLDRDVTDSTPDFLPSWTRDAVTPEQMKELRAMMMRYLRENPFYKGIRKAIESL